ncbi:MAG: DnaB-like helicase C-terminal domain-containing protein [Butyricicoccus sp.]|nr:DnaB-like helicase C-terminal domain-containing protein [Butyricicoccus sp.]
MDDVRTLPRQISSQAAVLGCLLIDPSLCGEIFSRVQAEDFITPEYRHVFEAAQRVFFSGKDVDAVTICHAAGGDGYRDLLMQIMDVTPTAAGWEEYVQVLREDVRLYRLRMAGDKLSACTNVRDGLSILAEAQQLGNEQSTARIVSMSQGLVDFHARQSETPDYLRFGIGFLDKRLRLSPGSFLVIGGRPSAGKTAFALQIADVIAHDRSVGFFSLETSEGQLYDRLVAQTCLIDFGDIKAHKISERDYIRLTDRQRELGARKLDIIRASGMSASDIQAITLAKRYQVIVIDYLQLLRETGSNANRTEAVSRMSIELHQLAQTHGVTVIALSQLGRPENKGETQQKAPTLSSLRESGQIEQDADAVLLLYLADPSNPSGDRRLKIAKNKEGELDAVNLNFEGRFQRFLEYMPEETRRASKRPPEQLKLGGQSA